MTISSDIDDISDASVCCTICRSREARACNRCSVEFNGNDSVSVLVPMCGHPRRDSVDARGDDGDDLEVSRALEETSGSVHHLRALSAVITTNALS